MYFLMELLHEGTKLVTLDARPRCTYLYMLGSKGLS